MPETKLKACRTLTFVNTGDTDGFSDLESRRSMDELKKETNYRRAPITSSSRVMYLTLENIKNEEIVHLKPNTR